jgi:hypothetical protein
LTEIAKPVWLLTLPKVKAKNAWFSILALTGWVAAPVLASNFGIHGQQSL